MRCPRNRVNFKLRRIGQRQAHATQGLDAVQSRDIVPAVQPIAAVSAPRRAQQTDGVVVMQRAHRETGALGQFAGSEKHGGSIHA